jgi:hypothetical protein
MRATLGIIGKAIVDGSRYLPIRNRAAALATLAPPKDYMGQLRAIFGDFIRRWRYVKDPYGRELVETSPQAVFHLVMGGRSQDPGVGFGKGASDCDGAAVAMGAQLASIGFPVRVATIAPQGMPAGPMMSHVFVQAQVPGRGWVTVDPVVHPKRGLGYTPPHSRLAVWDLRGQLMDQSGNARGLGEMIEIEEDTMNLGNVEDWQDYSGLGDYADDGEELLDFRTYGVKDFGIYADTMGMLGGMGIGAEVDVDERGLAWTPMIELAPYDYRYMQRVGRPYHGMLGLSDLCDPMVYDENLGFFKKIFRRVRKRVRSIGKKLLKKIPGGKFLMKLGKKVWGVAKKFVRPLVKLVGKVAPKLAPIAALIPGYGSAIAAGLYTAGKVANLMRKYDVAVTGGGGGTPAKVKFKSGKLAKRFQKALKKAAKKEKRRMKDVKKRMRSRISRGRPPARYRGRSRRARPTPIRQLRSRAIAQRGWGRRSFRGYDPREVSPALRHLF